MKLELVIKSESTHVELVKDEKNLLGLNIVASRKELGPTVKNVTPKSAAARSFAITQGDTLLSVNGQSTSGKKIKDVIRMMKNAGPCINLEFQYKLHELRISRSGVYRKQQLTTNLKKENGNFGFVLRKKDSPEHCHCAEYPIISNIKEESQVHKETQMLDGDRLISVDGLNLSWLSLAEIASVLQDKDEAEFTYEYNVRLVDFVELKQRIDLEIDIPISDLGLNIGMHTDSAMYVASIQMGSVAERCGLFSEGDVVISISDIEANHLTPSKADFLLRNSKKVRKISFIKTIRKEIDAVGISNPLELSTIASREGDTTDSTTSGIETTDWKHVNTPASSNIAFSVQQNYYSQKFCHSEQMESLAKLQRMVPVMSSLKRDLLRLADEAFNAGQDAMDEKCSLCDRPRHSVKLCSSCLAKMNTQCAESMNFLTNIIVQFINSSTRPRSISPQSVIGTTGKRVVERQSARFSIRSTAIALTETLPKIFPHLQKDFAELAEKVCRADSSCSTCDFEVKSVVLIVQKLLLLLSLKDSSERIWDLIEELISCLLETKFTCDGRAELVSSDADNECSLSTSQNLSDEEILRPNPNTSLATSSSLRSSLESLPRRIRNGTESITNASRPNTETNLDYLKIVHIQSVSESQNSIPTNKAKRNDTADGASLPDENLPTNLAGNNLKKCSVPSTSKETLIKKETRNGKNVELISKVGRSSVCSFLKLKKKRSKHSTAIQNRSQPTSSQSKLAEQSEDIPGTSSNIQNVSRNDCRTTERGNISSSSGLSTRSCRRAFENENYHERERVSSETTEIKLSNNGDGFGLGLSLQTVDDNASIMLVVHAVKPNSPSHKIGILTVGDRILAINHQSTLGLNTRDLVELKNEAFSADSIVLTIQFDVLNKEPKFGTFDVVLKRTLKTGLIFKAMKKGSPMVVSGVLKGSAAHRCGQLFVGDKIMAIKCNRSENFDPMTNSCKKEASVRVTVQRDHHQELKKKLIGKSPYYINPAFSYEDFVPRNGTNFAVRRTVIRAAGSSEALDFDQEVTLFRDPQFWDFGFMVGEGEKKGRAYVVDIRPDGPAHQSGVIKKLDRIVEVNGVPVNRDLGNSVLVLLAQADHKVDLLIRRPYHEDPKIPYTDTE